MNKKIKLGVNILLLGLLVIFFLVFFTGINDAIIWFCLLVFYAFFIGSISKPIVVFKGIKTNIKIDTFFMLFYYLIYYYPYQRYLFGLDDLSQNVFLSKTYSEYSNPAIIMATIGLVAFHMGFNKVFKKKSEKVFRTYGKQYFKKLLVIVTFLTVLILFLYAKTGMRAMFLGVYVGSKTGDITYDAIFSLVTYFIILSAISVVYYYINFKKLNMLTVFLSSIVLIWSLALLVLGDRNTFFIIGIVVVAGYYTFIKSISRKKIILMFFAALFLYQVVEVSRRSEERSLTAIWEAMTESNVVKEGIDIGSFGITTITARATFKIMEFNHDFFLGKFKIVSLASIVPYSSRLFIDKNELYTGSSNVLKEDMIGSYTSWGTGTNIITDCYMDFGLLGVVVLMYFIGWFGSYVIHKVSECPNTPKWIFIYLITLGYYAELARYGFDFPLRSIVWTIVLFTILDKGLKFRPQESNNALRRVN